MSTGTQERVARARELRAQGQKYREIAAELGVSISYVSQWLNDPDGTRAQARREAYVKRNTGTCVDCGAPTHGHNARGAAPERCGPCWHADRKVWTREAIILAIQEWAAEYGEPPAVADWNATTARKTYGDEARAQRHEQALAEGRCPGHMTVYATFGSWNAAIIAAGFEPRAGHGGDGNSARRRTYRNGRSA